MTDDDIKKPSKPHDEFYRRALDHNQVAQELFSNYLPKEILQLVDLATLTPEKDTFTDAVIGNGSADAVFSVKFDDEDGYLILLAEHQSTCDYFMTQRINKYMCLIYEQHRSRYPESKYLPPIYPLIYYTGKAKYTAPLDFFSLFKRPELAKSFMTGAYQLIDLHRTEDSELGKAVWVGAMMLVMKYARSQDIGPHIVAINPVLEKIGKENFLYIEAIFSYIIKQGDTSEIHKVVDIFQNLVKEEDKEQIMTIAERLIQEGKNSGIEQGLERGRSEGKHDALVAVATTMLQKGCDITSIIEFTNLQKSEVTDLAAQITKH